MGWNYTPTVTSENVTGGPTPLLPGGDPFDRPRAKRRTIRASRWAGDSRASSQRNPIDHQTDGWKNGMFIWLVVSTPLKNISQVGWLFPIYGQMKNVPNHQSVMDVYHQLVVWILQPCLAYQSCECWVLCWVFMIVDPIGSGLLTTITIITRVITRVTTKFMMNISNWLGCTGRTDLR